ncbi:Fe-S cluster assembly protein SufD [Kovacikia minuta CCNUW1]|uniref:Fe-S cluster assembly protein SufD n=1 Tax=Kovacikia minuta TaxID=2931930 RepID=UPI001CCEADC1|nr:Fe-S cluster assembly protein SufD [Kovacikia minuta]UBF29347.1 Fe-S cluster assembly protein SufD [Kovacikia minuta CCNUW1]
MTGQVSTVSDEAVTNGKARGDRAAYLKSLLDLRSDFKSSYVDANTEDAGTNAWLQDLRDRATEVVLKSAIPSTRDEEWRFTDLSALLENSFSSGYPASKVNEAERQRLPLSEAKIRLTFENGIPAGSEFEIRASLPEGLVVSSLLKRERKLPPNILEMLTENEETFTSINASLPSSIPPLKAEELATVFNTSESLAGTEDVRRLLQGHLATLAGTEDVFTALNTASFTDAAVIFVPKNVDVSIPIQLLFIATPRDRASIAHPRCIVVAESGSKLTLIEEYVTLYDGAYFTNPVTEIWVGENAEVNHTRIQRDSQEAFHIGKTAVSQARDSRYTCNAISYGAKLSRHNLEVYQTGEQTETTLNGLTLIGDEQVADTHSLISFTKPHGTSHQIHKCIVDDRAHAVFNGKILVPKPAQLTDAGQLSSTLLLSEKARVDTKPQLEITADNVKCAHGATVSQLDSDEVFYLQSRGIDAESARRLLTYAFAYDVLKEIPVPSLRDTLAQSVRNHF